MVGLKRFLVTGCSRSGTKYASRLFRALGVRCGHEDVFGPYQVIGRDHVDWDGHDADASWLAVPFLPLDDTVVLHQVRHPLEVVRSLIGIHFLADWNHDYEEYPRAVRLYAPEVFAPESEIERAVLHWRIWNERAETHASITYRLEDLDAELLLRLAEAIDLNLSEAEANEAIERTPRNVNARQRDESISWDAIAPLLGNLPDRYGY